MTVEITNDDLSIINQILNYKSRYVQDILIENDLAYSGDKKKLKERIIDYVTNEKISMDELTSLLKDIEEYGDQQIFLFQLTDYQLGSLNEDNLLNIVRDNELENIYNAYNPLNMPENPEIVYMEYDGGVFKIRWGAERKELLEPNDEIFERNGNTYLERTYLLNQNREITLFQVSLIDGEAELLIPTGNNKDYNEQKQFFIDNICGLFGWDPLDEITLNIAIDNLYGSDEVRARNMKLETALGSYIDISSSSKDSGISEDPSANETKENLDDCLANNGHFYWLPCVAFNSEIYSRLYENRFSIAGQRTEEEINHVIRRIRHYNQ